MITGKEICDFIKKEVGCDYSMYYNDKNKTFRKLKWYRSYNDFKYTEDSIAKPVRDFLTKQGVPFISVEVQRTRSLHGRGYISLVVKLPID